MLRFYVSQYWGVKDIKNIRRTLGIDIILGGGMALLFTAIAIFAAPQVLGLFSSDPRVIELGTEYLHIVAISYFFTRCPLPSTLTVVPSIC